MKHFDSEQDGKAEAGSRIARIDERMDRLTGELSRLHAELVGSTALPMRMAPLSLAGFEVAVAAAPELVPTGSAARRGPDRLSIDAVRAAPFLLSTTSEGGDRPSLERAMRKIARTLTD